MSNVVRFPDAQLTKLAQTVNAETVRNQAKIIIALEDSVRLLVFCIENRVPLDSESGRAAIDLAKRLVS